MASGSVSMRRALLAGTSLMALALLPPPALAGPGQTIANQTVATVTNPAGQSVTSIAITGSTVTGAVANAGTISPGKAIGGSTIVGVFVNNSSVGGGVSNTGTINVTTGADAFGISVTRDNALSGGITNSGTIIVSTGKSGSGIFIANSTISGGITNTGTIIVSSGVNDNARGIEVGNTTVSGGITNGGVTNTGTITTNGGNAATGIFVAGSTISGGIANSGTITANGGNVAVGIATADGTISGGIANSGTITTNGGNIASGIETLFGTVSGGIANTGMIGVSAVNPNAGLKTSATGILVHGGVFSGGITNAGTISAAATGDGGSSFSRGIFLDALGGEATNLQTGVGSIFSGDVVNRDTITASASNNSQQVAAFSTGIAVTVRGGGVPAFNALSTGGSFTGSIVNSGTIAVTATNTGPANASGIAVAVHGGGNDGSGIAIANSTSTGGTFTGSVVNNGAVTASASGIGDGKSIEGAAGIAVSFLSPFPLAGVTETQGTFAGSITNTGTITVSAKGSGLGAFGILVGQTVNQVVQTGVFTGAIANSGAITATGTGGASGVGIKVLNAIPGGITNTGTIFGSTAAIDLSQEIGGSTVVTQAGGALFGAVKLSANADVLNFTGGTIFNAVTAPMGNKDVVAISGTGAVFAPTASVSGVSAFTVAPGSRLTLQVTPAQAPSINAGTIALAGTLNVAPQGNLFGFGLSQTYKNVFVADPPLSGSFASVTSPITLFSASLSPDPTTANALDLTLALSPSGLAASAQDLTQSLRLGLDAPRVLGQAVQDRLVASGGVLGEGTWSGAGAKTPGLGTSPIGLANLWVRGADQFGSASGTGSGVGYDVNRAAPLIGGVDWRFDHDIVAGVAATYVASSASFKDGSRTNVSSYQGAAYAGWAGGPWYALGSAVVSFNDFGTARLLTPFGLPGAATSSPSGQSYAGHAEAGYRWLLPAAGTNVTVTPYAALDYVNARIAGFSESGGFGALAVNSSDSNSFQTTLGVRLTSRIEIGSYGTLIPEVRLGWNHEFLDAAQTISASLVGVPGSSFSATGIAFGRDTALVGAGLSMELSPDAKVFVDYDGRLGSRLQEHSVSGGLRVRF